MQCAFKLNEWLISNIICVRILCNRVCVRVRARIGLSLGLWSIFRSSWMEVWINGIKSNLLHSPQCNVYFIQFQSRMCRNDFNKQTTTIKEKTKKKRNPFRLVHVIISLFGFSFNFKSSSCSMLFSSAGKKSLFVLWWHANDQLKKIRFHSLHAWSSL